MKNRLKKIFLKLLLLLSMVALQTSIDHPALAASEKTKGDFPLTELRAYLGAFRAIEELNLDTYQINHLGIGIEITENIDAREIEHDENLMKQYDESLKGNGIFLKIIHLTNEDDIGVALYKEFIYLTSEKNTLVTEDPTRPFITTRSHLFTEGKIISETKLEMIDKNKKVIGKTTSISTLKFVGNQLFSTITVKTDKGMEYCVNRTITATYYRTNALRQIDRSEQK